TPKLSFMVVDEADTMFDPSFSGMLESILAQTRAACDPSETQGPGSTRKAQLVVVGATFPGGVGEVLSQVTDLGGMVTIKSKNLHFLMPHVKQTFLKVRGADKLLELHQVLKAAEQDKAGVLVFCNRASTVNWLGYSLEDMGLRHVRLQGEMPASLRAGIFHSFQKGQVDVLICTDITSRGLDTQRVCLVVNYDFPESHTDYIHRAGRVGRVGSMEDGEVLSFVTTPGMWSWCRRLRRLPGGGQVCLGWSPPSGSLSPKQPKRRRKKRGCSTSGSATNKDITKAELTCLINLFSKMIVSRIARTSCVFIAFSK
ncbi:unnamed protein product, partial [Oncorhynchus mykiss]